MPAVNAFFTSLITSEGSMPLAWGAFAPAARGLLQVMKAMEETIIEAACTGDYNKALHAFVINPLVPSGQIAKELAAIYFRISAQ